MKEYWSYIALAISLTGGLLIAIFRNQLAKVGDNLSDKDSKARRRLSDTILIVVGVTLPVYMFIYGYRLPFDKVAMLWMMAGVGYFIVNVILFASIAFIRSLNIRLGDIRSVFQEFDDTHEATNKKIDEFINKYVFDKKRSRDSELVNERMKVLRQYIDVRIKLDTSKDPELRKELFKELEQCQKKFGEFGV